MTNTRIAILKVDYPEDKLSEKDQNLILAEFAGHFEQNPTKEGLS